MKVAIVGSRTTYDLNISDLFNVLPNKCYEIVSGGSGTVDLLAEKLAKSKNFKFKCFLPEYDKYGRNAPLVRNIQIIEYSDIVIAFWDGISKGTKFVIKEALKRDIEVRTIYVNSKYSILKENNIK